MRLGVDEKLIVFEAYDGREYSCNPRAIYEHMLHDSKYHGFRFIWVRSKNCFFSELENKPHTTVIRRHSKQYLKVMVAAKYWVFNASFPVYLKPRKSQILIHTWHGKPLKCLSIRGSSMPKYYTKKKIKNRIVRGKALSFLVTGAPVFTPLLRDAFGLNENSKTKILDKGYPRNSFLFSYTEEDVRIIKAALKIGENKKVVLYVPTFRPKSLFENDGAYKYTNPLDFVSLSAQLGDEYIILVRMHNLDRRTSRFKNLGNQVVDVNDVTDINHLYIISDLLLSDYSGAIFDYANLRRPIVYYLFDRIEYENLQGLNFDMSTFPGTVVENEEQISGAILSNLSNFSSDSGYEHFLEKYCPFDGEDCTRTMVEEIWPSPPKR